MSKKTIIVLAGNYGEFNHFVHECANDFIDFVYGELPKIRSVRADSVKTYGTFWEREDAGKLKAIADSRVFYSEPVIDWVKDYEGLRTMHAILKTLKNETVGGVPHFAGEPRAGLPVKYGELIEEMDAVLYKAEKYVSKKL